MASSILIRKCICSAIKDWKSQMNIASSLHTSWAAARKKHKSHKAPNIGSEQEDLLEAAADVAVTMKGIEQTTFSDLANQLSKLESTVAERAASQSIITTSEVTRKMKEKDDKAPPLSEHAKKRISLIKQIYMRTSHDGPKSKYKPGSNSAVDKLISNILDKEKAAKDSDSVDGQKDAEQEALSLTFDKLGRVTSHLASVEKNPVRGTKKIDRRQSSDYTERHQSKASFSHSKERDDSLIEKFKKDGKRRKREVRPTLAAKLSHHPDGSISGSDLLSGVEPLNIFNPSKWSSANQADTIPMLPGWMEQQEAELQESQLFPFNGFEEMIRMTNDGKVWKFPIDNEQGMDEELNTPFYEHVFLDKHLTAFPTTGPIRRFIELVSIGLSKNPYMSVKEKVAHIKWYEDYFREKQPLVTSERLLADNKEKLSEL